MHFQVPHCEGLFFPFCVIVESQRSVLLYTLIQKAKLIHLLSHQNISHSKEIPGVCVSFWTMSPLLYMYKVSVYQLWAIDLHFQLFSTFFPMLHFLKWGYWEMPVFFFFPFFLAGICSRALWPGTAERGEVPRGHALHLCWCTGPLPWQTCPGHKCWSSCSRARSPATVGPGWTSRYGPEQNSTICCTISGTMSNCVKEVLSEILSGFLCCIYLNTNMSKIIK